MVLRTVYLPPELDEALKQLAFKSSTSKGALIRQALRGFMTGIPPAAAAAEDDV